jgi:hypothetical protein
LDPNIGILLADLKVYTYITTSGTELSFALCDFRLKAADKFPKRPFVLNNHHAITSLSEHDFKRFGFGCAVVGSIQISVSVSFVSDRLHCAAGTCVKRAVWYWVWELMSSDPTDPSSSLVNLSSDSMEVPALVAGAGSRSSSASSAGHRVGNKTRKDNQGKPLAIKDAHGRTWFQ